MICAKSIWKGRRRMLNCVYTCNNCLVHDLYNNIHPWWSDCNMHAFKHGAMLATCTGMLYTTLAGIAPCYVYNTVEPQEWISLQRSWALQNTRPLSFSYTLACAKTAFGGFQDHVHTCTLMKNYFIMQKFLPEENLCQFTNGSHWKNFTFVDFCPVLMIT